ncbi:MAG: phosphate uptake regulator PhoU [Candidatus Thermoplasmatota archaeon]|nr:phosphate uptake regulator PhoU [Candidatus Thermoplasmatota archaeon]
MEVRRVQITGGSSFTISLPKEWIRSQSIEKNSPVGLNVQSDGTLLVCPHVDRGRVEKSKIFDLDSADIPITFRLLIGAYVMGFSSITIKKKGGLPQGVIDATMEFTQKAIGPEIIEEGEDRIVIKDLLNPTKMPFDKTLERMYIMVRYMHSDSISAFIEGRASLVDDIEQRDLEVDRLNWFLAHQYNVINDSNLALTTDFSDDDAEFYFVSGKVLERIGDHSVLIAKHSKKLLSHEKMNGLVNMIFEASQLSLELLDRAVNSWFHRDLGGANETVDSIDRLRGLCERIENLSLSRDEEQAIAIGKVVDSILRTGEYSTDIAENAINYMILHL